MNKYLIEIKSKEPNLRAGMSRFYLMGHDGPVEVRALSPQPKFNVEYKDTLVRCGNCGAKFMHTELEADSMMTEDGDVCSNTICPACREWDCCELEYEEAE